MSRPLRVQYVHEEKCPQCGSVDIIESHASGELICSSCGTVVAEHIIDPDREWREFESDSGSQQKSRVGGPQDEFTPGGDQLGTTINIGSDERYKGLQRAQLRSSKLANKSLFDGFRRIDELSDKIELPEKFRLRAKELFKKMDDAKALRGRNHEAIIAGCLYASLRLEKTPRTIKEIVAITDVPKKEIGKNFKYIMKTLNMNIESIAADNFMVRFTNNLNLPPYVASTAEEVTKKAKDLGIALGKSPITIAAAALFLVCSLTEQYKKAQKDIADVTGVSEPTIRNCLKDLEMHKKELIPASFLQRHASAAVKSIMNSTTNQDGSTLVPS